MSVRLREVVGWLLVLGGLGLFAGGCVTVVNKRLFSSLPFFFAGLVVFRGGLHLIKVATAAYACREAAGVAKPRQVLRPPRGSSHTPGTPRGNVVPGPQRATPGD